MTTSAVSGRISTPTKICLLVVGLALLAGSFGCSNDNVPELKNPEYLDSDTPDVSARETGSEDTGVAADTSTPPDVAADVGEDTVTVPSDESPPVAVETTLSASTAKVGDTVTVNCELRDEDGNTVETAEEPKYQLIAAPKAKFDSVKAREVVPSEVGDATIACASNTFSLVDRSPADLKIEPGDPHTVRTDLDKNVMEAGQTATATCTTYDKWGNEIPDAMTEVKLDAMGSGLMVKDNTVTIEKTGIYNVTCHVAGAQKEVGESLEVQPAPPASISLTPTPMRMVYGLGSVVRFSTVVNDKYGNRIRNAPVQYNVNPSANSFGRARWEFNKEGRFLVTATVKGMTEGGMKVEAKEEIVVNGEGPDIRCSNPADGEVRDIRPGSTIKLSGTVEDANGVQKLTIGGNQVNVSGKGNFSTSYKTRFGINFVDVVAVDKFGEENSTTCSFLVANRWHKEDQHMDDGVTMRLHQNGLDDKRRRGAPDSIGDLLYNVLDSQQLINEVHNAVRAQNPLYNKCQQKIFGRCVLRVKVKYRRTKLDGPNTVKLDWISGGLQADATLRKLAMRLDVDPAGDGWVKVAHIRVKISTNVRLRNGRPKASLRRVEKVDVGRVSLDLDSRFLNFIAGPLTNLFQGRIKRLIRDQIRDYIKKEFNQVLDSLFSSFDIRSLGQSFNVPQLDGSGSTKINFGVRFSSLGINNSRALFGVGTKFGTRANSHAGVTKGVPMPNGSIKLDPNTSKDVAVSIHAGILNHVLFTLWRGGMFDAKLDDSLLGRTAPKGTVAELRLGLPPVAIPRGPGQMDVQLGGANLRLKYPGIFDKPVNIRVGLVARTGVKLVGGEELKFLNINLTEFKFAPEGIALDDKSRSAIESFLKGLFQGVLDRSLNNSLPALPIPSFTIDRSIGKWGMTRYIGREMGLVGAALGGTNRHFLLKGNFGIK